MPQKGTHTWDLILHYHRCPKCGFILESREDFKYQAGKYIKEVECSRCKNHYVVTRSLKPTFGPIIGHPEPKEWDWSTS